MRVLFMNELYQKTDLEENFKQTLTRVIDKFIIKDGTEIGYACADYKKSLNNYGYTILELNQASDPPTWETTTILSRKLAIKLISKFKIKNIDDYNDLIGFLTLPPRNKNIIFKIKTIKLEPGQRTNTGQRCPSGGENRSVTYTRINNLAKNIKKGTKYPINTKRTANRTSSKITIYGNTDIAQQLDVSKALDKSGQPNKKNIVPITEAQLCAETEFLLRHLDELKVNNKRWFFGTLEDSINKITQIKK